MKVKYRKKFLKELSLIPAAQRTKIEQFVFKSLPAADSLHQLGVIEQMKGYPMCFKVRFGNYRIGLRMEDDAIVLEKAKDLLEHIYLSEIIKKRQNSRSSMNLDDLLNAEGLIRADLES